MNSWSFVFMLPSSSSSSSHDCLPEIHHSTEHAFCWTDLITIIQLRHVQCSTAKCFCLVCANEHVYCFLCLCCVPLFDLERNEGKNAMPCFTIQKNIAVLLLSTLVLLLDFVIVVVIERCVVCFCGRKHALVYP